MITSEAKTNPRAIIVGGSFAGLAVGRHLRHHTVDSKPLDIVLVEPKDFFEYTPGVLHLLTGSKAYEPLITPLSVACKGIQHIRGRFLGLQRSATDSASSNRAVIELDNKELRRLDFDALIICSGRPYAAPIRPSAGDKQIVTISDRKQEIENYLSALTKAVESADREVVIIGGGLVGVELMGEVVHRLKRKSDSSLARLVLLSRSKLLDTLPEAAGRFASSWLKRRGVEVLENDELVDNEKTSSASPPKDFKTKQGRTLRPALLIDCTGLPLEEKRQTNYEDVDTVYSPRGYVAVDEHLQVFQYPQQGIFSAGDVVEHSSGVGFACSTVRSPYGYQSSFPSVRNAHLAESQAEVVAENVRRYLSWKFSSQRLVTPKYQSYPQDAFGAKLNPLLSCVSLGPRDGIVVFNNIVLGGAIFYFLGGMIKFLIERSKISEIRGELWGSTFWAFGHVVVNMVHRWMIRVNRLISLVRSRIRLSKSNNESINQRMKEA